ncbi:MAG: ribonuclease III [Faecousia sp.]
MLKDLEAVIGYRFHNISLLQNALTHSSYANERWHNSLLSNERLEFLGDSVLGMLVAEYLYRNFPNRPEGELTRMRADMVCEQTLAAAAERIGIGSHLLLGHGEEQGGGRTRSSILADAMESVIAACFLDGGIEAALLIVRKYIFVEVPVTKLHNADYKTRLQEMVQQKKNQVLSYTLVGQSGPDHDKKFDVEVSLNGAVVGCGSGSSKKRAEQDAARAAIARLFPEQAE